jgi:hypothetical protein
MENPALVVAFPHVNSRIAAIRFRSGTSFEKTRGVKKGGKRERDVLNKKRIGVTKKKEKEGQDVLLARGLTALLQALLGWCGVEAVAGSSLGAEHFLQHGLPQPTECGKGQRLPGRKVGAGLVRGVDLATLAPWLYSFFMTLTLAFWHSCHLLRLLCARLLRWEPYGLLHFLAPLRRTLPMKVLRRRDPRDRAVT